MRKQATWAVDKLVWIENGWIVEGRFTKFQPMCVDIPTFPSAGKLGEVKAWKS
jgi:hypothetical protein